MKIRNVYSRLERVEFELDQSDIQRLIKEKIEKAYPNTALAGNGLYRVPTFEWGDDDEDRPYCIVTYTIETDAEEKND